MPRSTTTVDSRRRQQQRRTVESSRSEPTPLGLGAGAPARPRAGWAGSAPVPRAEHPTDSLSKLYLHSLRPQRQRPSQSQIRVVADPLLPPSRALPPRPRFPLPPPRAQTRREGEEATASSRGGQRSAGMATPTSSGDGSPPGSSDLVPPSYPEASPPSLPPFQPYLLSSPLLCAAPFRQICADLPN